MEQKIVVNKSARLIVGLVFAFIGMIFIPIGTGVHALVMRYVPGGTLFLILFAGMGSIFLAIGIILVMLEIKMRNLQNRLLAEGYYIYAEVLEVNRNLNIQYGNSGHPYVVKCGYTDENGTIHIFKSRNITRYPGNNLIGQQVRVYLDRNDYNNYKNYYMDIDEILPNVVEH